MGFIAVLAAAAASFAFGAVWYMALSGPWVAASGVALGADGKPSNGSDPKPFIIRACGHSLDRIGARPIFPLVRRFDRPDLGDRKGKSTQREGKLAAPVPGFAKIAQPCVI